MSDSLEQTIVDALSLIAHRCPRLIEQCYWAGTSCIAIEELHHRDSLDLDFHTRKAHLNVQPLLEELKKALEDKFSLLQIPDEYGSGFQGLLKLDSQREITIEVLANYEDVSPFELIQAKTAPVMRITLKRYLADKIQCVTERSEARDLVDIYAVLKKHPELEVTARNALLEQDALLITERLLNWSDQRIMDDLAAYPEVDPKNATSCRDELMKWLARPDERSTA